MVQTETGKTMNEMEEMEDEDEGLDDPGWLPRTCGGQPTLIRRVFEVAFEHIGDAGLAYIAPTMSGDDGYLVTVPPENPPDAPPDLVHLFNMARYTNCKNLLISKSVPVVKWLPVRRKKAGRD